MLDVKTTRRRFLQGSAALGATAMMNPGLSFSAEGSVLKIRSYSVFQILDPAFTLAAPEGWIGGAIFNKLVAFKPGTEWETELDAAEYIEQVDDTHIEFRLRPGIMFTNGYGEMTAEDVKFSYERIIDPEMKSAYTGDWATLDRVEVTGKYSGTIVLKEPFAPLWWSTLPYGSGDIISKKATEAAGGSFKGMDVPAVSGPYQIKEWVQKQKLVLERNPVWNGPKPDFDEIHLLPIDDEKSAELGFEAGDLDWTWVSVSSLPNYRSSPPKGSVLLESPSLYYVWLGMNVDHPLLQDIRVRKAIQRSIDVDAIMEAAYFGVAKPSTGIVAPGLLGHRDANLTPSKPDYEGAKKLLAEAGHSGGLKITLDTLNKPTYMASVQIIQANLLEIGIDVQINVHDSGSFWVLGSESSGDQWKNVQLFYQRYSMSPDPSWATMWFTCDQVGVWNWERVCNKEFDDLHKKAVVELDSDKRHVMYQKLQDLMEESGAYRFITHEATPSIYRDTIIPGVRPDGHPLLRHFRKA